MVYPEEIRGPERCPGDPDGIHTWIDATSICDSKRIYICSYCAAKKEGPLYLGDLDDRTN